MSETELQEIPFQHTDFFMKYITRVWNNLSSTKQKKVDNKQRPTTTLIVVDHKPFILSINKDKYDFSHHSDLYSNNYRLKHDQSDCKVCRDCKYHKTHHFSEYKNYTYISITHRNTI
jgi:hypothetical protein